MIGAPIDPGHAENQYDALVDRVLEDGHAPSGWSAAGR